jgi:exodeoxyribonuclease VII small subunit
VSEDCRNGCLVNRVGVERLMSESRESMTFEQALDELERIVKDLENGRTSLEDALRRYEQGVGLLKRCYGQLRQAEQRISELISMDASGNAVTRPFEHAATVESATVESAKGKNGG